MYGEKKYAEIVLLEVNLDKIFHYHIPENLRRDISWGARVLVPFKNKVVTGCVVGFLQKTAIKNLKDISQLVDVKPLLTPDIIKLTQWISDYYLCSWRKVLNYVIPKSKGKGISSFSSLEKAEIEDNDIFVDKNISLKSAERCISPDIEKLIKKSKKYQPILFCSENFDERIEVYFKFIQKILEEGKQIIILTPSESHLSVLAKIFRGRFGDRIAVFDENISQKNKYIKWLKIRNSQIDIALGMRSTIFVPFDKLGLVIVDQEHNGLYKEERAPRYNARKVALKRAELEKVPIILSSETPSLESYWNTLKNNYLKLNLISDKKENSLLKNKLIDMNKEKSKKKLISYELQESISKSLKKRKQVVLFLNRRGFSNFVICRKCGFVPKCSDCNHTLSYHLDFFNTAQLVCHSCGKRIRMLKICSRCGSEDIKPLGVGTQRLESEIKKMFPRSKIKRIDQDTIAQKEQYTKLLKDFKAGEIDILIGTQMVIKEVDFRNVDLVGIVSADTLLNLPDYRSSEKNFQLLYEVISSFKKIESPIEVIIQTFNPDHHSIIALKEQNYDYFYQREIALRKELDYPPFTHLIKIEVKGKEKEQVEQKMKLLIDYLDSICENEETPEFKLLGSKNIQAWKFRNIFGAQVIIKVKELEKFNKIIKKSLDKIVSNYFDKENRLTIDVDPIKML
ncbi:MAG TPA: primosomal protein N' [Candidatus Atribacteria bacterium]|nr:primosomal protein N' [Candidatus Atribacteria bacterium]